MPTGDVLAGLGSKGVNVTLVQRALLALGYKIGSADGSWGNNTQQAWVQFEASNGSPIIADGTFTSIELGVVSGYSNLYVAPAPTPTPTVTTTPVPTAPPVTVPADFHIPRSCQVGIDEVRMRNDKAAASPTSDARRDRLLDALYNATVLCAGYWPQPATDKAILLYASLQILDYAECTFETREFMDVLNSTVFVVVD